LSHTPERNEKLPFVTMSSLKQLPNPPKIETKTMKIEVGITVLVEKIYKLNKKGLSHGK